MATIPERWAAQAHYDLETARAMLASGRFLYVLFCCQQAVEKMLKGLVAKRTAEFPPRLHNLMRLAEFADVKLNERRADFLRELSDYYIESRYPEAMEATDAEANEILASDTLERTEEVMEWLFSML